MAILLNLVTECIIFRLFIASVFSRSTVFRSWLPYSDRAFSLACLITCLHASLADWYCSLFCGVGSFSQLLYNCFFNFVACLVSSFHHAVAFFCCPPDFFCPTIFSAVPWIINILEVCPLLFSRIQLVGKKLCQLVRGFLLILPVNIGLHKFLDVDWSSFNRSSYSVSLSFFSDCGYDHPVISAHILRWNNSGMIIKSLFERHIHGVFYGAAQVVGRICDIIILTEVCTSGTKHENLHKGGFGYADFKNRGKHNGIPMVSAQNWKLKMAATKTHFPR